MSARIEIRTAEGTLDLIQGAETEFYVTRQVFDLNDFETRNADFTKNLKIPTTPNNVKLLNAIADNSGTTGEETKKIECTILMDGITIAPVAWILVFKTAFDGVDQFFEATIFYGNFNMFDALSGNTIDRINWADIATNWETADLMPKTKNTYLNNDIVFPIADWNTRDSVGFAVRNILKNIVDVNVTGFFLYARNIIERMLLEAGYTLVVESAPADFNTIAVACPVTQFFDLEIANISFSATVINNATQNVVGVTARAIYQTELTGSIWNTGTNQFTVTQNLSNLTVKAFGSFDYVRGHPNNPPSRIVIFQQSPPAAAIEIAVFTQAATALGVEFFLSVQVNALINDIFYVELQVDNTNAPATMDFLTDNNFQMFTEGSDVSRLVQPSEYIPQIIQSTFLANILKLFNLIMVTDDIAKTVTINSFDVLFTNAEVDLSSQLAGGREPIEIDHFLGSLGQYTYLNWIEDNLLRRDANATIQFDNEILNKENTVISMDFSACDNSVLFYDPATDVFPKAKIPMASQDFERDVLEWGDVTFQPDGSFTFAGPTPPDFQVGDYFIFTSIGEELYRVIEKSGDEGKVQTPVSLVTYPLVGIMRFSAETPEPRLSIIQEDVAGVAPLYDMMQGSIETKIPFEIGSLTGSWLDSLKMSEVAATYYDKTFKSLQSPQVIRAKFNLSILRVANFDFLRPVYLSSYNAFYYVNKIEQFKVDSLTRMELIRITEGVPKADPIPPPPASNVKAHIVENTGSATILVYNLNVDGGNNVEPVGYAIFNEDQTVNFNARIRFTTGLYNMVVTNVGNGQSIGSWTLATDVTRNESLIMNVANTPLWDLGEIQYQVIEIQTI